MNDFFANLAARAIAQPALRPRTRLRFEPAEPVDEPLPPERRRPAGWPVGVPPPSFAEPLMISPPPQAEGEDAFRPAGEDAGAPREVTRELTRDVIHNTISREVERDVQRVVETKERVVRVPAATAPRPHRFDREPPRVIERHLPREIEEVHREREIRTTIDRPPRVIRERVETPAPSHEPVIEVSIGRIEVRAVTSAPPQRNAPRNTTMTIEDYVASRKAKERR